jgi:hypothetical protein
MKRSPVRLVATLLLSGQMLPVGLPLLCGQSGFLGPNTTFVSYLAPRLSPPPQA